jgi:hypothetical protein
MPGGTDNHRRVVGDGELVVLQPLRRLPLVDERRAGDQGEERIVDGGGEICRIDHRSVRSAPEPVAHGPPRVALRLAVIERILGVRRRLHLAGLARRPVG